MGVFGKSTKVSRAVTDPGTDDSLPSPGALSWGGITAASGVAGTTGADAKLVKGDRWQQIVGSHTENMTGNVRTTILGGHNRSVNGNQTLHTTGNVTRNIVGNLATTITSAELRTNIGVQNLCHMAPKIRNHAGEELTSEVGSFFRSVQNLFEAHQSKLEGTLAKVVFSATSMEFAGLKLAVANTRIQPDPLRLDAGGIRVATRLLDNVIRGVRASVVASALQVASFEGDVQTRLQMPPESTMGIGVPLE